jgi:hypothetical protein
MLAMHCHTSLGPSAYGLMDALKNSGRIVDRCNHFEHAPAVALQYPPLKCTPNFFHVMGKSEIDSGVVNNFARTFVPAFVPVTQDMQPRDNIWQCN